jgi:di/tricarboxylate transporter
MDTATLSLIIFIATIVLFIIDKLPMATTAVLGCTVMVLSGVSDFRTAFGQFSSATVILTIGVMIIGESISETGLADLIGNWIVKVSKGSEKKLIAAAYFASCCMSAFLTNSAVLAIFMPIVIGIGRSNKAIKPIAYGCVLGGASTLVGSTQQMTAQGLLEETGNRVFRTFDFTPVVGIIIILGGIYCLTIGYSLGQKIWGNRPDEIDEFKSTHVAVEANKPKMIIMAVFFAATVVLYITEWIPLAITSTTAALLCIITGCISQKKAIFSVDWNIVGRLAASLGLAKALESAGGTALITEIFKYVVGENISPLLLFCIVVFLVQMTSNFMSNSTAILIVLPIIIAIAPEMGLNTYAYALGITIGAGIPLSCPLASSTLGMSMSAGYEFNDYFKYSIIFEIVSYSTVIILVPLLYGLTV